MGHFAGFNRNSPGSGHTQACPKPLQAFSGIVSNMTLNAAPRDPSSRSRGSMDPPWRSTISRETQRPSPVPTSCVRDSLQLLLRLGQLLDHCSRRAWIKSRDVDEIDGCFQRIIDFMRHSGRQTGRGAKLFSVAKNAFCLAIVADVAQHEACRSQSLWLQDCRQVPWYFR